MEQNREPKNRPVWYRQLILDKGTKIIFTQVDIGITGHTHDKKKKKKNPDADLTPFTKINSNGSYA